MEDNTPDNIDPHTPSSIVCDTIAARVLYAATPLQH